MQSDFLKSHNTEGYALEIMYRMGLLKDVTYTVLHHSTGKSYTLACVTTSAGVVFRFRPYKMEK